MAEHSPLPWKYENCWISSGNTGSFKDRICGVATFLLPDDPSLHHRNDADGELIVRAVNHHERLVGLLWRVVDFVKAHELDGWENDLPHDLVLEIATTIAAWDRPAGPPPAGE